MKTKKSEDFLTSKELAARWKLHVGTLANWRAKSKGPKYQLLGGRKIIYALSEIIKYETKGTK